jgi:hypothetical protein
MKRNRQPQLALETAQPRKRETLRLWEAVVVLRRAGRNVHRAGDGCALVDGERLALPRLLHEAATIRAELDFAENAAGLLRTIDR